MEKLFYTNSSASSSQPRNSRVSFRFQFPAAEQQGEEAQGRGKNKDSANREKYKARTEFSAILRHPALDAGFTKHCMTPS